MKIHTLHVKNGHCTILEHNGRKSLVDINKLSQSELNEEYVDEKAVLEKFGDSTGGYVYNATNPIAYWRSKFGNEKAFRTIITHPDQDHLRGIKEFNDTIGMVNLWMPTMHIDEMSDGDDGSFIRSVVRGRQEGITFIEPKRGSNRPYFGTTERDWDQIQILHPTENFNSLSKNDGSYLIKVHYGKSSVIIGGDTEPITFKWLYEHYPEDLKCTLFIASHHGRQSGWPGKTILEHMNPLLVIVPKGKIERKDDACENYRRVLGKNRYITTAFAGNIRIELTNNDNILSLECERQYANDKLPNMLSDARLSRWLMTLSNYLL